MHWIHNRIPQHLCFQKLIFTNSCRLQIRYLFSKFDRIIFLLHILIPNSVDYTIQFIRPYQLILVTNFSYNLFFVFLNLTFVCIIFSIDNHCFVYACGPLQINNLFHLPVCQTHFGLMRTRPTLAVDFQSVVGPTEHLSQFWHFALRACNIQVDEFV